MKQNLIAHLLLILIATFGFILPAYSLQNDQQIVTLSPKAAAELIAQRKGDSDFVIIDIRTLGEYKAGHIHDSILIDYYSKSFADKLKQLDKTKAYLIYCRSGNRSGRSIQVFIKLKFNTVYHLASGIIGWRSEGLPIVK